MRVRRHAVLTEINFMPRRPKNLPPLELTLGLKVGKWTILEITDREVEIECECGFKRISSLNTLKYHQSGKCRQCCGNSKTTKVTGSLSGQHVYMAIRSFSEAQRQYAAAILKSRRSYEDEVEVALTRQDVLEAIEMAQRMPSARAAEAIAQLSALGDGDVRQCYPQYISPA